MIIFLFVDPQVLTVVVMVVVVVGVRAAPQGLRNNLTPPQEKKDEPRYPSVSGEARVCVCVCVCVCITNCDVYK